MAAAKAQHSDQFCRIAEARINVHIGMGFGKRFRVATNSSLGVEFCIPANAARRKELTIYVIHIKEKLASEILLMGIDRSGVKVEELGILQHLLFICKLMVRVVVVGWPDP